MMRPVQDDLSNALVVMLKDQPISRGKIAFAWRTVVGTAVSRATEVELQPRGTLVVRVGNVHWRREVERLAPTIVRRLERFLGRGVVTGLDVVAERRLEPHPHS